MYALGGIKVDPGGARAYTLGGLGGIKVDPGGARAYTLGALGYSLLDPPTAGSSFSLLDPPAAGSFSLLSPPAPSGYRLLDPSSGLRLDPILPSGNVTYDAEQDAFVEEITVVAPPTPSTPTAPSVPGWDLGAGFQTVLDWLGTGARAGSTARQQAALLAAQQAQRDRQSNTGLYVGLGLAAVAVGAVIWAAVS